MIMTRNTKQMQAIRSVFKEERRPLSPAELHETARKHVPNLGMATIYRAIQRLREAGEIQAVDVPGQAPRYELQEAAARHHHHFLCRACDKMFDIEGCPSGIENLAPEGFVVEGHHLTLTGICSPRCPNAPKG